VSRLVDLTWARRGAGHTDRMNLLRQALRLWRGPALAGTGLPEISNRPTLALTEEQLAAEEECVDAELQAGNHVVVRGRLLELVTRHPHRQRFVAQLMIAQCRAGMTADALATKRLARFAGTHALARPFVTGTHRLLPAGTLVACEPADGCGYSARRQDEPYEIRPPRAGGQCPWGMPRSDGRSAIDVIGRRNV
jgi:hypothetical protein